MLTEQGENSYSLESRANKEIEHLKELAKERSHKKFLEQYSVKNLSYFFSNLYVLSSITSGICIYTNCIIS